MEAYDKLLESWLTLVQDEEHFPRGCFVQPAIQVFNSYIQCHLAAPDGTRNLVRLCPFFAFTSKNKFHFSSMIKKTVLWRGESVYKQQTFILTILLFSVHVQYWFELCLVGFPHQNKHGHSPSFSQCTSFLWHVCVIHKPWKTLGPPPFSQRTAFRLMKRRRSTSCRKTTESCSRTNCRALACWDVWLRTTVSPCSQRKL